MSASRLKATQLDQLVEVGVNYQRSVRADSSVAAERLLGGYVPTERSLDLLGRVLGSSAFGPQPRAWSVTGPYGSGKSSFMAFLGALLGDASSVAHGLALARLAGTSALFSAELLEARRRTGVDAKGYIIAIATATKEPVNAAIARALLGGAERYWVGRGRKPTVLHAARQLVERGAVTAQELLELFAALENNAPVLLGIDEFGKTLEFAAEKPTAGDLYALQLLAEHCSLAVGVPSCVITLQHLSVADYSQALPPASRREWLKVEGRFEDVAFVGSFDQAVSLVRGHLTRARVDHIFEGAVTRWAERARQLAPLAASPFLASLCASAEDYYPLHPLAVALAPAVSQRYGQGDRSLHAWLASNEHASVAGFLAEHRFGPGPELPVYGSFELFDYFLGQPAIGGRPVRPDGRWLEILGRVQESAGLGQLEEWLVRTVALLNLAGGSTELRASASLLEFAARVEGIGSAGDVARALASLKAEGFLVYREFADEYRVWQGSDVDIDGEIRLAREQLANMDTIPELDRVAPPAARVAQRHGHQTGTFRYFRTLHAVGELSAVDRQSLGDADGILVLAFADPGSQKSTVPAYLDGRPIVVCETPDSAVVQTALREVLSLDIAFASRAVASDPAARREVRARQALASEELTRRMRTAFDPTRPDLTWHSLGVRVTVDGPKALSSLLSDVCDATYGSCVPLRNEILNRVRLTSQGAKARRELLEHLLRRASEPSLGIEGFGPERSMYESLVVSMDLHGESAAGGWELRAPGADSGARPAWDAIDAFLEAASETQRSLDGVLAVLARPPFGVREPVASVLLLVYLSVHRDDVAIYQDGTFEPELSDPLVERFLKAPERFEARRVLNGGTRDLVVQELSAGLSTSARASGMRNAGMLAALRPAVATVRGLPDYSRYTKAVSDAARCVRAAILEARRLDDLLFSDLPRAVGLPAIPLDGAPDPKNARAFAGRLSAALSELAHAYDALLETLQAQAREAFGIPEGASTRVNLRERVRRMQGHVIDPKLRSFVVYASDERLDDVAWLEALALNLADKPASSWRDADADVFGTRLRELAGLFARVEYLCCAVDASDAAEGFIARRISVTRPDGRELSRVVWADERELEELRAQAKTLIGQLGGVAGHRKVSAFLAVLADEVLLEPEDSALRGPKLEGGVVDADSRAG